MHNLIYVIGMLLSAAIILSTATEPLFANDDIAVTEVEKLSVTGSKMNPHEIPGSAHEIDSEDLKLGQYTDIHRALRQTPGINIQEEDGSGLRPNIGMRGSDPHRSKRVLLLEDGVPIAPAPYSAPAAYYFPLMGRVTGIEILKGPASIAYGHSGVNGAINLKTENLSNKTANAIAEYGQFDHRFVSGLISQDFSDFSLSYQGGLLDFGGFKNLDGGGETGFRKWENLFKTDWSFTTLGIPQNLTVKYSFAGEKSHETYLGLSVEDFNKTPYRRYAGSQRDEMSWRSDQIALIHEMNLSHDSQVTTRLYYNEFHRVWDKISKFGGSSPSIAEVLSDPSGGNQTLYQILRGNQDSNPLSPDENLINGINDRSYVSTGAQIQWRKDNIYLGEIENSFQTGIQMHYDAIRRSHSEQAYLMENGIKQKSDASYKTLQNKDSTAVMGINASVTSTWQNHSLLYGILLQQLSSTRKDRTPDPVEDITISRRLVQPGVGYTYDPTESLTLFVGAYRSLFAPPPGSESSLKNEQSINYEYGTKFQTQFSQLELIGFYNNYDNIIGSCSFSRGCDDDQLDQSFEGGKARVYGIEAFISHRKPLNSIMLGIDTNYTYSIARFRNEFESENPQWGEGIVRVQDPIPYIPTHQGSVTLLALINDQVQTRLSYIYQGIRYDQAVAAGRQELEAYDYWDAQLLVSFWESYKAKFSGENLTNKVQSVSIRPFGHRPLKPRTFKIGLEASI